MALTPTLAGGASSDDLPYEVASNLPREVWESINASNVLKDHKLSAHLNPDYLHGDFDGDGRRDTAVLVRHTTSGKTGIAVFHADRRDPILIGGGAPVAASRGDDLNWVGAWQIRQKGPVSSAYEAGPSPTLRGDALYVEKLESASALLYWTGSAYAWYQQGD